MPILVCTYDKNVSIEVCRWLKKGKIMSTKLVNDSYMFDVFFSNNLLVALNLVKVSRFNEEVAS